MESSDCFEKYFGDEINLVPQHSSSLFPFTPTSSPYLPEFQTHYLGALQTFPLGCPTNNSKSIYSVNELIIFPTKLSFLPYPNLRVRQHYPLSQDFFLLCQTSSGHQLLLNLPSKISTSVLFSLFPPPAQDQAFLSCL